MQQLKELGVTMYKNWETTTLKLCVHSDKENPISAEKNIYISVGDSDSGPYLILEQVESDLGRQILKMEYSQFLKVADAAKTIMHQMYVEKINLELNNG